MSLRVGLAGYGYWGVNLARNFDLTKGCELVAIADADYGRRATSAELYPDARILEDARAMITSDEVDAVALATPPPTHYELAALALEHGKHVLVEKPLTTDVDDAEALVALAERRGLTLMVDHTVVYSGPVRAMRELIEGGELGDVWFVEGSRLQAPVRSDVNVIQDLAVHDISVLEYALGSSPVAISATGFAPPLYEGTLPSALSHVHMRFPDLDAHLQLGWIAPQKERRMLIGGSKAMLVFDDLQADQPVRVYEWSIERVEQDGAVRYLTEHEGGSFHAPRVDQREPLAAMALHFVECATTGERPLTDGLAGLRAVRAVSAASESLEQGGVTIPIGE